MIRDNLKINKEYGQKWRRIKYIYNKIYSGNFLIDQKKYYKLNFAQQKKRWLDNSLFFHGKKLENLNFEKIYFINFDYINSIILNYVLKFDEIIDLGSGYGERMYLLKPFLKKNTKIFLGEFTSDGINAQKFIIKKYKFDNIKSFVFDYNDLDKKYSFKLKNPVFTTFQSIEQITNLKTNFLPNLKKKFNLRKINILHLEPIGFQTKKNDKFDLKSKIYNKKNSYNQNLLHLVKKQKVKNFSIYKNIYSVIDKKGDSRFSTLSLITYNF